MKIETAIRKNNKNIFDLKKEEKELEGAILFFKELSTSKKYFSKAEIEKFECSKKEMKYLIQKKSHTLIKFLEAKLRSCKYCLSDSLLIKDDLSKLKSISKLFTKDERNLSIIYNEDLSLSILNKENLMCNITHYDGPTFWSDIGNYEEFQKEEIIDMFPFLIFHLDTL